MNDTTMTPLRVRTVLNVNSPADLVEAVPYLLGTDPVDSLVLIGQCPGADGVGPVLRHDLPQPRHYGKVADHFAGVMAKAGADSVSIVINTDSAPHPDAHRHHQALYEELVRACRIWKLTLREAVCVADRRWSSYLCADTRCCPAAGTPLRDATAGPSAVVVAATLAGLSTPVPLPVLRARLRPPEYLARRALEQAFDRCAADLVPRAERESSAPGIRHEGIALRNAARTRYRARDRTLTPDQAARLVVAVGDVEVRDRAMSWADDAGAPSQLELWTALARSSWGPGQAPPLTLTAYCAWIADQPAFARVAVNLAVEADPDYTMAQLLHTAINSHLDPREVRRTLFGPGDESLRFADAA